MVAVVTTCKTLNAMYRLGDFDPADMVPYQQIGPDHLNTPENQVRAFSYYILLQHL